jgi:carboxyl-terminal processing protease
MKHNILSILVVLAAVYLSPANAENQKTDPLPLTELRAFAEVFARIKQDYVEPVDDKKLLQDAIQGMLHGLDPHSSYLDEEEFAELKTGASGEFSGLGIEIGIEDGFVKVIAPIDDTPAQRAGILAGDLIIRINQQSVKGMTLDEAVSLMRGEPGSEVLLHILRDGREKPFAVKLRRAVVKTNSVKRRMLADGFGYIRLSHFQQPTPDDMLVAIGVLKRKANNALKGLVLDLRNNPGGVLNAAVTVSDAFLTEGAIVYTEGRTKNSQLRFKAVPDDVLEGAPMVVLVDGGSASASEIVAGALQDHRRAVIMGQRTFGKGSVQTIVPVNETAGIKLTTARYFTPNGRSIQAEGIKPDIELVNITVNAADEETTALKEADLAGHLTNPESHKDPVSVIEQDEISTQDDYVLSQALNLLKGLVILHMD